MGMDDKTLKVCDTQTKTNSRWTDRPEGKKRNRLLLHTSKEFHSMKFSQKEIEYLKRLVINEINREAQLEGRAVVWRIDLKRKPEDMSNDVYNKLSELEGDK